MIRIAAAGDLHYDRNSSGRLKQHAASLERDADLFVLAGDLTQLGTPEEAEALADDLSAIRIPIVAVLGNHDFQSDCAPVVMNILRDAGVTVLEKQSTIVKIGPCRLGIAGMKGFGGGFVGACGSDFGEPEMKSFIRHTMDLAHHLKQDLLSLQTDYKLALLHYSPIAETLLGEKREIFPFLGSYLLAEAVDEGGADLVFHGHAHRGVERGMTPKGVPVRNVAQPVIRHVYHIYDLNKEGLQSVKAETRHEALT